MLEESTFTEEDIINEIVNQIEKSKNIDEENNNFYRDVFVTAPTGAGKSVMFQVPALVMWKERRAWTLVIEPTVSLMVDQVTTLNAKGISAGYISQNHPMTYESITYLNASGTARPMKDRGCILYVTPERRE